MSEFMPNPDRTEETAEDIGEGCSSIPKQCLEFAYKHRELELVCSKS